jgi:hypothetical protein
MNEKLTTEELVKQLINQIKVKFKVPLIMIVVVIMEEIHNFVLKSIYETVNTQSKI